MEEKLDKLLAGQSQLTTEIAVIATRLDAKETHL